MSLLSRVADRIYWGARYIERAEDTARVIRAYGDLLVDMPVELPLRWDPLVALAGSSALFTQGQTQSPQSQSQSQLQSQSQPTSQSTSTAAAPADESTEHRVIAFLVADRGNPGSVASSVALARENLRTTREVLPREAWQTLNGLHQYVSSEADRAIGRRTRDRFLGRVVDDSRRLDGQIESTMTRAAPYRMWQLGRLIERADMTTRVLGVRAAAILEMDGSSFEDDHDEVQWMGVLRSVSALQMYQRATHGPIEGGSVVRFLLYYSRFPRSVQGCLDELRSVVATLPSPEPVLVALDAADAALASCAPGADDGAVLDDAMDTVQNALAVLDRSISERYCALGA